MVGRVPAPEGQAAEPDERLLIEAAQKDPSRFADLYEMHFDRVYAYVARRLPDRSVAQDVTAEVFHRALANLKSYEWRGVPFAAWLYRIAANAIATHARKAARDRNLPAGVETAEQVSEEIERRASLYGAVRDLPPDQRRVIQMRFGQERSIREIAQALQRTEGAVKQLQFRALKNLRARLDQTNG
jgi:RNA polymerase sigma-70 factor (ECF subfamily)